ncbi:Carboxylic acid transporter protein-like protein [Psilocybe cubensis]|uniref:Carboxylic acid transporter protein-like protein n=1 Tax=Psilocybe cubensis TaxID=181762 RepID=A0ACB8GZN3_PSICU|nr:Carboxylic acid transporter protein-like protein [Psilocybe cubensis]KAH9480892.1 Carboxylic acid transporter protein-like protein [Psilocybe cubensis]
MAPYFLRNIVPRRETRAGARPLLTVLRELTWVQWALFFSGWLAWTCDSIDFFSVSLSVTHLQTQFNRDTHDITTAITLTLLFRSVGAAIFGILSDRYGRKWPLIWNLILVAILELGAGFVQTFRQFLALRSLFGIGMGGIWGLAASTALENLPVEARGIASGFLQEGYAVGYLIAAVINLFLVPEVSASWRSLFWTASGISLFAAFIRMLLPESEVFLRAKAADMASGRDTSKKTKIFIHETKEMLKRHWLLCIYSVLLMTGFNFLSHGSQDLYPTYLTASKGFTSHDATVATIIGNCVSVGGVFAGWLSQYIGRRLTIVIHLLLIGAFIPLWILPSTFSALSAGAFCIQFGVQGAWGVIPIQLAEMSPPAFRATFPGVAYQLGNMVSSASAQIEATGGDNLRTTIIKNGTPTDVPDYATIRRNHGSHFEKAKTAFEEGGGRGEMVQNEANDGIRRESDSESGDEKRGSIIEAEKAVNSI